MKILFLHKNPKECARLHNDDELVAKIPQYTRLLAGAFTVKHGSNPFDTIESPYYKESEDCNWLLKNKTHRSWLFNVIRHLIKEYDKRLGNSKFQRQREIMEEISNWGNMDGIDWTGTGL